MPFAESTRMQIAASSAADPIEILMEEHRLIERVLDALDAKADAPARFAEFFREFADDQHHQKEEGILFLAMLDAGFPHEQGPIAVMLADHERGRELIAELAAADGWTPEVEAAARNYSALMRQHIQKEDRILYPMARRVLGRDLGRVGAACAESVRANAAAEDRLRALAAELISRAAIG
jgi:hemerythrin-like domain-containing protein